VQRATGVTPTLSARLADLHERAERFDVLPNDLGAIKAHIQRRILAEA
jgi:threonine synthase